VSDGSDDDATGKVAERLLATWPGRQRYIWNHRPGPALVDNLNRAIELATASGSTSCTTTICCRTRAPRCWTRSTVPGPDERVLLSGVRIVDPDGIPMREQSFHHERYLEPTEALRRLLRNSSFVQQPAVVVARSGSNATACSTRRWVRPPTRTCGSGCSPATAFGACPQDLRIHDPRGRHHGWDVESRRLRRSSTVPSPCSSCRSRRSGVGRPTPPPVHPRRRLPAAAARRMAEGSRGAAAVRASRGPQARPLAQSGCPSARRS
jgi:hypothetical protein